MSIIDELGAYDQLIIDEEKKIMLLRTVTEPFRAPWFVMSRKVYSTASSTQRKPTFTDKTCTTSSITAKDFSQPHDKHTSTTSTTREEVAVGVVVEDSLEAGIYT